MAAYVLLVDHDHAKVYKLLPGKVEEKVLKNEHHLHHTHGDEKQHKDDGHYFGNIVKHMPDASEVLVTGPGLAKNHFKTHLEKHDPNFAKKIVGTETFDSHHMTENQLFALARKFFKAHDQFA